jgi:prephenate dehydratase
MLIAFQGETGAYSEAAGAKFAPEATFLPCPAFEDVFAAVEDGRAGCGVLPIENSIGGTIHRNYDLLVQNELKIVAEVELPVRHSLLALPGTRMEDLRQVYSHPQALAQCDRFLRALKGVEILASYDTAGSAKMIREQHMAGVGAVASERAAAVFGLETLRAGIQDHDDNTTRFLIVTRPADTAAFLAGHAVNKTTIVFTLPNTPGALFKALSVFALRDIDVTKIESRPTGRPWEYLFHLDLAVGQHDLRCGRALSHIAEFAPSLKVLGSYPGVARSADTPPVAKDARVAGGVS